MQASLIHPHLETIFKAGLDRVDPYKMIMDHVRLTGNCLEIAFETQTRKVNLTAFKQIFILGAGKATAPMAQAFESILGDRIKKGAIAVKYGHTAPLDRVEMVEAGHPQPDENGVIASRKIMALADRADRDTLVITLVSGGGSALLPLPLDADSGLTLADKQAITRELLACGADITEINCIRKHLSGIKGGVSWKK